MAHFLLTDLEEVLPVEDNLTTDDNSWGIGDKAHNREGTHALATGTLTNETYALSLIYMIREVINCPDFPILSVEIGSQVLDFKYFLCDVSLPLSVQILLGSGQAKYNFGQPS